MVDEIDDLFSDDNLEDADKEKESKEQKEPEKKEEEKEEEKKSEKEETKGEDKSVDVDAKLEPLKNQITEIGDKLNSILSKVQSSKDVTKEEKSDFSDNVTKAKSRIQKLIDNKTVTPFWVETIENLLDDLNTIKTGGKYKDVSGLVQDVESAIGQLSKGYSSLSESQMGTDLTAAISELKANTKFNKEGALFTVSDWLETEYLPRLKDPEEKKALIKALKGGTAAANYLSVLYKNELAEAHLSDDYLKEKKRLKEASETRKKNHANPGGTQASMSTKKDEKKEKEKSFDEKTRDAMLNMIGAPGFNL